MLILEYPILPLSRCCPELQDTLYLTRNHAPPGSSNIDLFCIWLHYSQQDLASKNRKILVPHKVAQHWPQFTNVTSCG